MTNVNTISVGRGLCALFFWSTLSLVSAHFIPNYDYSPIYNQQNLPKIVAVTGDEIGCNKCVLIEPGVSVVIKSPKSLHDNNYQMSIYCLRTFIGTAASSVIKLQCSSNFHIENGPKTCMTADYMQIWETIPNRSKYYCGTERPPVMKTRTRVLNVGFYSNYQNTFSGFDCRVTALPNAYVTALPNAYVTATPLKPKIFTCGIREIDSSDEIYDEDVISGEFPWIAVIRNKLSPTDICGGSLISCNLVLTSASCIIDKYIEDLQVVLGAVNLNFDDTYDGNDMLFFDIANVVIHPNFYRPDLSNDIAIVKFSANVKDFTKTVHPICLPNSDRHTADEGVIAGWQSLPWAPGIQDEMQKTRIFIVKSSLCNNLVSYFPVEECQVCGFNPQEEAGLCRADVGGPLMVEENSQFFLYGIASFVEDCRLPVPAIFTDVSKYLDWIKENSIYEMESCKYY